MRSKESLDQDQEKGLNEIKGIIESTTREGFGWDQRNHWIKIKRRVWMGSKESLNDHQEKSLDEIKGIIE